MMSPDLYYNEPEPPHYEYCSWCDAMVDAWDDKPLTPVANYTRLCDVCLPEWSPN
jgi:hypothetical protein